MARIFGTAGPFMGSAIRGRVSRATGTLGFLFALFAFASAWFYAQTSRADEATPQPIQASASDWIVTLGAWGGIAPDYSSSSHYEFYGLPIVDVHRRGTKDWLNLPKDGLDYELIETDAFRAGPVADIRWGFGKTDDRGLKEVASTCLDRSLELGGFAEYWPTNFWRTRLEARKAVFGAEGWAFDLSSDFVWYPTPKWTFAAGPRLSLADQDYMNAYYGINAQQSQTLQLPKYDASGGLRSYGAGLFAQYKWSEQLSTMASFEYERLSGSAADSPLAKVDGSVDQLTFELGAKYNFVWVQ